MGAIVEASTIYLYSKTCPKTIKKYIPHAKLIIILRQPVEQAFSMFLHDLRSGFYQEYLAENDPSYLEKHFAEEFLASEELDETWLYHWHYKEMSAYYEQVKRYFDLFDSKNIKIFLFNEFKQNTKQCLQEIFSFLGVDINVIPSNLNQKYNAHETLSQIPQNAALHRFLMNPSPLKKVIKPLLSQELRGKINYWLRKRNMVETNKPLDVELSKDTRQKLTEFQWEDILKLQDLIGRDLSH